MPKFIKKSANIFRLCVLTAVFLFASYSSAWADVTIGQTFAEAGRKAYVHGQYLEAQRMFEAALREAEAAGIEDYKLADYLIDVANCNLALGKYLEAEPLYKHATSIYEQAQDVDQLSVVQAINNLAAVYALQGKYSQAQPLYEHALSICEQSNNLDNVITAATAHNNLANLYAEQGRFPEAITNYNAALDSFKKLKGAEDDIAMAESNLALVYLSQKKFTEAEELLKQALEIREKLANQPELATCLNNMAALQFAQRKFNESQSTCKRALDIWERSLGNEHPDLALCLNTLGDCSLALGSYADAEDYYKKALAIKERCLGTANPEVARSAAALGKCYFKQGKYSDAEPLYKRALEIYEKIQETDHTRIASAVVNLAELYVAQGNYPEAEAFYKRALSMVDKADEPESLEMAECLKGLAQLYRSQGKMADAENLYKRALTIEEKKLGSDSLEVCSTLNKLGRLYQDQNKLPEAAQEYKRLLSIQEKILGPESPELISCLNELAGIDASMHEFDESQCLYQRSLVLTEKSFGPNSLELATSLNGLGRLYRLQNQIDQAEPLFQRASKIIENNDQAQSQTLLASTPTAGVSAAAINRAVEDKWALVIGISKFKDPKLGLQYASKDATDFYKYLIEDAHFAPDHVQLLLDNEATRENILAYLGDKWLPRVANPDDLVLIYISSHGTASQMDMSGVNYIIAYDTNPASLYATGIPLQDLAHIVKERVHCDRVAMILDACHSGAATAGNKGLLRTLNFNAEQIVQGTGQLVICSSEPNQTSWESKEYPNGVFTHQLIQALRAKGSNTELGTACEIMRKQVQQEVLRDRGELQTPVLMSKWEGRNLILAVPPTNPRPGMQELLIPTASQKPVSIDKGKDITSPAKLRTKQLMMYHTRELW